MNIQTREDMAAEIARLYEQSAMHSDGLTVEELAEAWGCRMTTAYTRVRKLVRSGTLEHCRRPGGVAIDGRAVTNSAYRLKAD